MVFIGIDPGVSGGLAALDGAGHVLSAIKMPDTDVAVYAWMRGFGEYSTTRAVIERVNAGVWGGKKRGQKMGVTSAFTFGRGVGALQMGLHAAGIVFHEVEPREWQDALTCRSGGDKNITKTRAIELFPDSNITHRIADALLIAHYCRLLHTGGLDVPSSSSTNTQGRDSGRHGQKSKGKARRGTAEGF